ncbi:ubiquitin C-terminal hydrolase L3 [Mycena rebaudengoi]|nr:ubiquitin C-terminal hydrolase L3 [Mycena rebaudengoi]
MTDRDSDLNLKDEFSGIPLESDPAIFTDLVHALGATALEFQDVLSLNADDLRSGDLALPSPLYAFVLVYNATREYEAGVRAERQQARDQGRGYSGRGDAEPVFWVEQTIKHACGMFAMIHAVANLRRGPDGQDFIDSDSLLAELLRMSIPLGPVERAAALKSSEGIARVYNSAAKRGTSPVDDDDVPGHYVCFVRSAKDGHIYELDGGKNGPVDHDAFLEGDRDMVSGGLKLVRHFVESKLDAANPHFHLMALVPSQNSV